MKTIFLFVFLTVSGFATSSFGQKRKHSNEVPDLFHPELNKLVIYDNGIMPFRKGDKWGFVGQDGQMLITPRYDSIFYAGKNYCLVKDTSGFQLLNDSLQPVFQKPFYDARYGATWDSYDRIPAIRIQTKAGKRNDLPEYDHHTWVGVSVYKTYLDQHPKPYPTYAPEPNLIDSLRYEAGSKTADSILTVYLNGREPRQFSYSNDRPLQFVAPHYIHKRDTLLNLLTGRESGTFSEDLHGAFIHRDTLWYNRAKYNSSDELIYYWFESEFGDTVLFRAEQRNLQIDYKTPGFVKKTYGVYEDARSDLFFFPSMQPIALGLKEAWYQNNGFTYLEDTIGNYHYLNAKGQIVYSGKGKIVHNGKPEKNDGYPEIQSDDYSESTDPNRLLGLEFLEPDKKHQNLLISSTGKVLFKTKLHILLWDFHSSKNPVVHFKKDDKLEFCAIYDLKGDSLIFLPYQYVRKRTEHVFEAGYFEGDNRTFLLDLHGNKITEKGLGHLAWFPEGERAVEAFLCYRDTSETFELRDKYGKLIDSTVYTDQYVANYWQPLQFLNLKKGDKWTSYDIHLHPFQLPGNTYIVDADRLCSQWVYWISTDQEPYVVGIYDERLKVILPVKYKRIASLTKNYFYVEKASGLSYYMKCDLVPLYEE